MICLSCFLTAKAKDEDKIEGFRAGGDDYLSKPFNMEELQLRVKAILRRMNPVVVDKTPPSEVVVGGCGVGLPHLPGDDAGEGRFVDQCAV
ncbi:MAG: hypothetical protein M5U34_30550 [Chloroflexi bacterium]|nr:hypothetical protein [Chloroflexota bacterium]